MDFLQDLYTVTIIRKTLEAFQASVLEAVVLFSVVLGLITLLIFVYFFQKKRKYARRRAFAETRFQEALKDKALDPEEKELLELMAHEIPGRELRKHALVTNSATFDSAAQGLLKRNRLSGKAAASLRIKLGFPSALENETIYITAEIPQGKRIYLRWKDMKTREETVKGRIKEISPEGLAVELEKPAGKPSEATVLFVQKSGIYRFTAPVIREEGTDLILEHTDAVTKKQQRRFFRKEMKKPAIIETSEKGETKGYRTYLYDLGGGGAKIQNPKKLFSSGDDISLRFSLDDTELHLKGGVARTSDNNTYLHVEFKNLKDSERDRIMGYLFTQ